MVIVLLLLISKYSEDHDPMRSKTFGRGSWLWPLSCSCPLLEHGANPSALAIILLETGHRKRIKQRAKACRLQCDELALRISCPLIILALPWGRA